LLILDEPFTGLDASNRKYVGGVLARLMRTPLRVLVLTTRPEDLPSGITHVMEVDECKSISAGPRRDFSRRNRYRNPDRNRLGLGRREKQVIRITTAITPGKELVRIRNVTVAYGKRTILKRVNWTVREGESWALLGPNGS